MLSGRGMGKVTEAWAAWNERGRWKMNTEAVAGAITDEQLEAGLTEDDAKVRASCAAVSERKLSHAQISRGLKDADCTVRAAVAA